MIFPPNPLLFPEEITVGDKTYKTICVDVDTEKIMQRQRLIAMYVGSPLVVYAGYKLENKLLRIATVAMGIACFVVHRKQHQLVTKAFNEFPPEFGGGNSGSGAGSSW